MASSRGPAASVAAPLSRTKTAPAPASRSCSDTSEGGFRRVSRAQFLRYRCRSHVQRVARTVKSPTLRDALDPSPTKIGGCADGVGLDELPWHRDLGHLEGNVAAMAQNPGANLDQLLSGARYCSKWYIDDSDG